MSWLQHKLEGFSTPLLPAPEKVSQSVTFDWGTVGTRCKEWTTPLTVTFKENDDGNTRD